MAKQCKICGKSFSLPIFPIHEKKCLKKVPQKEVKKTQSVVETIETKTEVNVEHLIKLDVKTLRQHAMELGAEESKVKFSSKDRVIKMIKKLLEE